MFHRLRSLLVGILLGCTVAFAGCDKDFDPKCPEGYYPGIVVTEGQYTVPFERMYNLTGSFFHAEWYIQPTTNYGEDNTVGATRRGVLDGYGFDEKLVRVFKDDAEAMIGYMNQTPLRFPNPSGGRVSTYHSYLEELRLISICEGNATLVHMFTSYCADDVVNSCDAWGRFRRTLLNAVIVGEGAQEFKGTCPGPLPK
ncbi:hypothetical protein BDZ89DRAFT_368387 [Hymenopellis radicata]|nr:hypothetical protein BDZ89DRAFT_368387 [Hymenopellis radicata]